MIGAVVALAFVLFATFGMNMLAKMGEKSDKKKEPKQEFLGTAERVMKP
jgi:hypothetical protein